MDPASTACWKRPSNRSACIRKPTSRSACGCCGPSVTSPASTPDHEFRRILVERGKRTVAAVPKSSARMKCGSCAFARAPSRRSPRSRSRRSDDRRDHSFMFSRIGHLSESRWPSQCPDCQVPLFFQIASIQVSMTEVGSGTSAPSMMRRQLQIRWGHIHNASKHRVVEDPCYRLWKHGCIACTRISQHAWGGDCRLGIAGRKQTTPC